MKKTLLVTATMAAMAISAEATPVADGGQGSNTQWRGNGKAVGNPSRASSTADVVYSVPEGGAGMLGLAALAGVTLLGTATLRKREAA